ncbi:PorT family protein [uncultured Brachyspira sp.]|uniref:PorT family protein n=1 Tax=uncultured Brachyspira sp. TaxID=221953 RepID=UPI00259BD038|nr:PorT family protein [uncultured Brachyspira sp.]
MKKIKKFLLAIAMTMIFSVSAFAASGLEFLLNVPFGINWGIPNNVANENSMTGYLGFDVGVDAQIGYMISVKDGFGVSVLAELGYSFDIYQLNRTALYGIDMTTWYHSFKVGVLPKFNIGFGGRHGLAVGIGGGVKIPISGWLGISQSIENTSGSSSFNEIRDIIKADLKRQDISNMFSPSVIGYVKVTFDYYLFFTDNIGMNFGLYLGGDFAPKQKDTELGLNAFDFGLQLGFRFGPKA